MEMFCVYVAGRDEMELYAKFTEEKKAIRCANTLRYSGQPGSIIVYKEIVKKIYSA